MGSSYQENPQQSLFGNDPERVTKYQAHSETSTQAAHQIENAASTLRGKVYREILSTGEYGITDEGLQTRLAMNPSTERPRRVELVERGLVFDSGNKRKTISGRAAVVWRARG